MCPCLKQKLLDISYNKSNISNLSKENFETFNINIFSDSIKTNDFTRIAGLKDEGYIPSPKIIDELKGSAPAPTMIAVQKIFGLPSDTPGLSNIKLAQSDNQIAGKNIEQSL